MSIEHFFAVVDYLSESKYDPLTLFLIAAITFIAITLVKKDSRK